jgi:hypothetical protein
MCNISVFEKDTGRFIGVVGGSLTIHEGKFITKGALGFIVVDLNIHTTRPATDEELEKVFRLDFYADVKDSPNISIARYHDAAHAEALNKKWLESKLSK